MSSHLYQRYPIYTCGDTTVLSIFFTPSNGTPIDPFKGLVVLVVYVYRTRTSYKLNKFLVVHRSRLTRFTHFLPLIPISLLCVLWVPIVYREVVVIIKWRPHSVGSNLRCVLGSYIDLGTVHNWRIDTEEPERLPATHLTLVVPWVYRLYLPYSKCSSSIYLFSNLRLLFCLKKIFLKKDEKFMYCCLRHNN